MLVLCKCTSLTDSQLSLLNKGLNFIPTKGINKDIKPQSRFDLQNYHRRLKLLVYYRDEGESNPQPFTSSSTWTPPDASLPPHVRELISADLNFYQNSFKTLRATPNVTPEDKSALSELLKNDQIVIKPADKGSVVVVMDRAQYLWEGHRQLADTRYYKKLDKPIFWETINLISNIFQKLYEKKFINAKQRNYLRGETQPRPRRFYLLPKIHKDPMTWSKPNEIPPGRPIVSDCGSETYRSAEFIDFYLNPLAKKHDSYIKDTYDFIQKIRAIEIPTNSLLFTMDVDSLYTNIDTQEGIQAVRDIFLKHRDLKRPDKELLQLLEINLTRNDFEFDGQYFLQTKGTAMGKKFAPAYADIFMAAWETTALQKCPKKPLYYYRYLDDIWGIWTHSTQEFTEFMNILNSHNPSITLKSETNYNSVHFLDTTTFKGPNFTQHNRLDVKVYFKDTDTHALLHKSSFHPKHTFAGLIKSQLLRFHRICSQTEDFMSATKVLFSALASRGYTRTFLRTCFKSFLHTKPIQITTSLPLVVTFSPSTTNLVRHVKQNFQRIINENSPELDMRVIAAYRKNRNLSDYLVRAKVKAESSEKQSSHHHFFRPIKWIYDVHGQRVFHTSFNTNLDTRNCVYVMICKQCDMKYVGETSITLRQRLWIHKHNIIRHKHTNRYVVQHFIRHGWDAVLTSILESNPHWSTAQRRRAERDWIQKLDTTFPRGLNQTIYYRP